MPDTRFDLDLDESRVTVDAAAMAARDRRDLDVDDALAVFAGDLLDSLDGVPFVMSLPRDRGGLVTVSATSSASRQACRDLPQLGRLLVERGTLVPDLGVD